MLTHTLILTGIISLIVTYKKQNSIPCLTIFYIYFGLYLLNYLYEMIDHNMHVFELILYFIGVFASLLFIYYRKKL